MFRIPYTALLSLAAVLVPVESTALQRAFVASYGSDANTASGCLLSSPCRGFAAAMTVVDAGGEIVALDAAGYAAVTVNKSVTITSNPGFFAGIAAPAGTAVNINAPGANVTLRGLNINGTGGTHGVWLVSGSRVSIENCIISNFSDVGVRIDTAASVRVVGTTVRDNSSVGIYVGSGASALINGVRMLGNGNFGLYVFGSGSPTLVSLSDSVVSGSGAGARAEAPAPSASARLVISRSTFANNAVGIHSTAPSGFASVVVTETTVTGSATSALLQEGAATLHSLGNNALTHNVADKTGTISSMAPQ